MSEVKYSYGCDGVYLGLGNTRLSYKETCDKLNSLLDEAAENKRGWDRASLVALRLEQRAKRAEACIAAIENEIKTTAFAFLGDTEVETIVQEFRKKENEDKTTRAPGEHSAQS
jgi:hypothetical protein